MTKRERRRESDIMRDIQIYASTIGWRLFRNNVGVAYSKRGARIRFGLCNGSSDLIGFDDKGRFVGAEIKTEEGRIMPTQVRWMTIVNASGGRAFIVRSVGDFRKQIDSLTRIH